MAEPVARGVVPASGDGPLTDETLMAKVLLKTGSDHRTVYGVAFGTAARLVWHDVSVLLTCSVPGEWLALGPPGSRDLLRDRLETAAATIDGLVTVIDLTHGRALLRLTGPDAARVLARECALDVAARPDGTALRTAVAGVATDIVRDGDSYLLHCERSSGHYLYDCLRAVW